MYAHRLLIPLASLAILAGCAKGNNAEEGTATPATNGSIDSRTTEARPNEEPAAPAATVPVAKVVSSSGSELPEAGSDATFGSDAPDAPTFAWEFPDGDKGSLEDYRGKVVLLNFWATWCPPCRRELPDIVRLREELGPKGFEVIGVSVGERPHPGVTEEQHLALFAEQNKLNYPMLLGTDDLMSAYGGISAVPTSYVIDKEGKVVQRFIGAKTADQFRAAVEKML